MIGHRGGLVVDLGCVVQRGDPRVWLWRGLEVVRGAWLLLENREEVCTGGVTNGVGATRQSRWPESVKKRGAGALAANSMLVSPAERDCPRQRGRTASASDRLSTTSYVHLLRARVRVAMETYARTNGEHCGRERNECAQPPRGPPMECRSTGMPINDCENTRRSDDLWQSAGGERPCVPTPAAHPAAHSILNRRTSDCRMTRCACDPPRQMSGRRPHRAGPARSSAIAVGRHPFPVAPERQPLGQVNHRLG